MILKIEPIASALGAQVSGIDLAQPLAQENREALIRAWHKHQVLRFRDQLLTPRALMDFSLNFGDLELHENYLAEVRHESHPEVLMVRSTTVRGERVVFGQQWHADLTYTTRPAKGACLHCLRLPDAGGDTLFANTILAYEALSAPMRRIIDALEVVHDLTNGRSYADKSHEQVMAARLRNPPVIQPMVRVHPDTGRKALNVSEWMCRRIVGMSEEESRGILQFLFEQATRPEFTFRQSWKVGDLVMWDNASTLHMALADYAPDQLRELMRTSLIGTPSGRLLESAPCN